MPGVQQPQLGSATLQQIEPHERNQTAGSTHAKTSGSLHGAEAVDDNKRRNPQLER